MTNIVPFPTRQPAVKSPREEKVDIIKQLAVAFGLDPSVLNGPVCEHCKRLGQHPANPTMRKMVKLDLGPRPGDDVA